MHLTRCLPTIALMVIALSFSVSCCATHSEAASLAFQKSKANTHVALQPRIDHHRVHVVVKAEGLKDVQCMAQLTCSIDDGTTAISSVLFTPTDNAQVFAIYLRTVKSLKHTATYRIDIGPFDGTGPDITQKGSLVYQWTIKRDADGQPTIEAPSSGDRITVTYVVARRVPIGDDDSNVEITWKLVYETRTKEVVIPQGFVFGVDDRFNGEDVYDAVRVLNSGG